MQRSKSEELLQLEVALKRISANSSFYAAIKEDLLKQASGHHGERNVDYYLQYAPAHVEHIQDVRLFDGIQYFQIDSLLTSNDQLFIMDVKNHKGKLIFDFDNQQLIREYAGQKDYFQDPFIQAEHHKIQLTRWLHHHHFPSIHIEPYIILSNPHTISKTHGRDIHHYKKRIVRAKRLPYLLNKTVAPPQHAAWSEEERLRFRELVQQKHTPFKASIVKKFRLEVDDFLWGVECPDCGRFGMERRRDHWYCRCGTKSSEAHLKLLREFSFLFGNEITNAVFRKIASISSEYIARKLLNACCKTNFGRTNNRKYYIII